MARAFRVGIHTFWTLNGPLSGELCVVGGSLRHRRARKSRLRAKSSSLGSTAGSDDGGEPTAGESAHTSAAHAADRKPCADSAGGDEDGTMRAPIQGGTPKAEDEKTKGEARAARPLPRDAWEFVKEVNEERQLVTVVTGMLDVEVDPRVKQPVVKQLLEMAYPKQGRAVEQERPSKISVNVPR
jgi:hypothetical protein